MCTVAITQSNYIPWKGYFDTLARADVCVLLDEVQYTRRDWRNRNRIKTSQGLQWLTIPVQVKGKYDQRIDETLVSDERWAENHWQQIVHAYGKSPAFPQFGPEIEALYKTVPGPRLSEINYHFLLGLSKLIGFTPQLLWSTDFEKRSGKTERLIDICTTLGATRYLTGPSAQGYIDDGLFTKAGIAVEYLDYSGYAEHPQLFPPFIHEVSVIDLLLNTGTEAQNFMKHARQATVQAAK